MKFHPLLLALVALPAGPQPQPYLIGLSDPPLVEHVRAASPPLAPKAVVRRAMQSAEGLGYARMLTVHRESVLRAAAQELGHAVTPRHTFQTASNGFSAVLDDAEAARI